MRDGQAETGGDDLLARLRDVATSCGPDGRLPAERLLTQMLGVGRGRLRGALAQLEAEGHVFRRQGQGTFVVPSPAPSRRALQRLATTISPADVMEVRRQIEPALAALAARRACDADIAGLRTLAAAAAPPRIRRPTRRRTKSFITASPNCRARSCSCASTRKSARCGR